VSFFNYGDGTDDPEPRVFEPFFLLSLGPCIGSVKVIFGTLLVQESCLD
jgi:hypothetical protein